MGPKKMPDENPVEINIGTKSVTYFLCEVAAK